MNYNRELANIALNKIPKEVKDKVKSIADTIRKLQEEKQMLIAKALSDSGYIEGKPEDAMARVIIDSHLECL